MIDGDSHIAFAGEIFAEVAHQVAVTRVTVRDNH